ncbi:MAG: MFS transporter [Prevotellaceae bacterium]|jgi:MFS family permease|nr:MFS transporter [Prevotellaceae bacterium]
MEKARLVTAGYCFILAANFLLYFGFYLLLPVLPFYLIDTFHTSESKVGMVLSCYVVAALMIRPFSGYLLDTFARKPFYLLAFFIFTAVFAGYPVAGTLTLFIVLRVFHGFSFGAVSVAGNTIVIDITPSSRRGEALGYYGLSNNIAMAVGPMTGLFLHDYYSFDVIFLCSLLSCALGFVMATRVKTPVRQPVKREPLSLDRFILLKGIPISVVLVLLSIPYGMTNTYIALYGRSIGIEGGIGIFFTLLAAGTAISRLFSGRQVDRGRIPQVITFGMAMVCLCFFILASCAWLMTHCPALGKGIFFSIALFFGLGFGSMFPAFNTMFVNLASNNQRGTATSTYLTSWDVGVGLGLTAGGFIAEISTLQHAYSLSGGLVALSMLIFIWKITPFYLKNKL